MMNGNLFGTCE